MYDCSCVKDTVNLLKRENIYHLEVITSPPTSNFQ
jgi:hypothetical protein